MEKKNVPKIVITMEFVTKENAFVLRDSMANYAKILCVQMTVSEKVHALMENVDAKICIRVRAVK